ncbi:MAG: hypothetical protein V3R67_03500 [Thermodesulfobacteriota bacterium]
MANLRRVTFTKKTKSDRGGFDYEHNAQGYFHEWGNSLEVGENGEALQEVVGIVEDAFKGQVHKAEPNSIVFVDKLKD